MRVHARRNWVGGASGGQLVGGVRGRVWDERGPGAISGMGRRGRRRKK